MMRRDGGNYEYFEDIVEAIFAAPDRQTAEDIIESYDSYWMQIVGTRGFKGKKTKNANTMFNAHFDVIEQPKVDNTSDDSVELDTSALDKLENEQT